MSIQAIRKTGFLIEDATLLGSVIGYLRCRTNDQFAIGLAASLDAIRALPYYEPVQPKLITEQIEEVTA